MKKCSQLQATDTFPLFRDRLAVVSGTWGILLHVLYWNIAVSLPCRKRKKETNKIKRFSKKVNRMLVLISIFATFLLSSYKLDPASRNWGAVSPTCVAKASWLKSS